MTGFHDVIAKWDADARTGGKHIHPLDPESEAFWQLGHAQGSQVTQYATPGDFVIDFGCGIGRLAFPLAAMGFNVLAVDASQSMLDRLTEHAAAKGLEVGTLRSDGSDLPKIVDELIGQRADLVIARAVLIHHSYADVTRTVRSLAAVLRPGGVFIADWPTAPPARVHERADWIDVTTWHPHHRLAVAELAGLEPVDTAADASVWRKVAP